MKKTSIKKLLAVTAILMSVMFAALAFAACGAYDSAGKAPSLVSEDPSYPSPGGTPDAEAPEPPSGNEYNTIVENKFILTSAEPASRFSMDANTAAYANLRRAINDGRTVNPNQVRIEELLNYFSYDYQKPEAGEALAASGVISACPWNNQSMLLTVGVAAKEIEFSGIRNNLVFLMDISGSMNSPDKMALMQAAFCMLSDNLNDDDVVSIVTYAGGNHTVLSGEPGINRKKIQNAIEDLMAGGSTGGAGGIKTAYELAQANFIEGGNNRIILATDGDFNVGISSQSELENFIKGKRSTRVGLTILGFGYGNLKDNKLETLANNAFEGNYAYVDSILEARKVLVDEIGGTLVTVARDVKAQVEFNPQKVHSYRLLGYENKLISKEDWDNPDKIAGDVGSGHTVTAVYEMVLSEELGIRSEELRMNADTEAVGLAPAVAGQGFSIASLAASVDAYATISVRYKDPAVGADDIPPADQNGQDGREISVPVTSVTDTPSDDVLFISSVVEAALVMRNSQYKGSSNLQSVITRLQSIQSLANDPYKAEFLQLMVKLSNR
ncbi:MAG: von Willebrand factor type A domain-containing protein [Firmicutes bacterium]|nr:von Willebrand factor type A domain-containing protein [Bacillota bacterium]